MAEVLRFKLSKSCRRTMFGKKDDFAALGRRLFGSSKAPIRLMGPDDLDEVLRFIRLHDTDDYKAAKLAFAHTGFAQPVEHHAHFVVIEPDERRPVGVIGYSIDDLEARGTYWLGWTYVNPFFRGKGYGSQLMVYVKEVLRELGARKLFLSTSGLEKYATAVSFYERHGFAREGRLIDFYADGDDKLIMGCRIDTGTPPRTSHVEDALARRPSPERTKRDDDDGSSSGGSSSGGGGVVFEF